VHPSLARAPAHAPEASERSVREFTVRAPSSTERHTIYCDEMMDPMAQSSDLDLAAHVGSRYRITRRIGSGGMADVYLADDLLLERLVAIKVLHACYRSDPARLERFRREAKTLAAVTSPHVVGIYDLEVTSACPYLVMQYVPGRTLAAVVEQDQQIGPVRAGAILHQVLEGLVALHARGLVHRDIKPSNVIVDARDRVVLLDVGIAIDARQPRLTEPGFFAGTPGYFPPERLATQQVDLRSDLYQVGLLLAYMLTGVDPGDTHVGGDIAEQVSTAYADVLRRALSAVDGRFASATEMSRALEEARERCNTSQLDPQLLAALLAEHDGTVKLPPLPRREDAREAASSIDSGAPPLPREAETVVLAADPGARDTHRHRHLRREMMPPLDHPPRRILNLSFWTPLAIATIILIVAMVVG
jgi:eukaryotic-like serine/threonine-protein kinase